MYQVQVYGRWVTVNSWRLAKRIHRWMGSPVYSLAMNRIVLAAE